MRLVAQISGINHSLTDHLIQILIVPREYQTAHLYLRVERLMSVLESPETTTGRFVARIGSNLAVLLLIASLAACSSLPGYNLFAGKGRVIYNASSWCVPFRLKRVLRGVARKYGTVTVHSTYRTWWHNRKVGGARRSMHRRCKAVDFSVNGNMRAAYRYVKRHRSVGGYKRYSSGHIHIDTGSKRTW